MVTLVIRTVAGLQIRLGVSTASRFEKPCFWLARALANATPTGPVFDPIMRSMCATSLPSPTSASPMYIDMAELLSTWDDVQATRNTLAAAGGSSISFRGFLGRAGASNFSVDLLRAGSIFLRNPHFAPSRLFREPARLPGTDSAEEAQSRDFPTRP